MPRWRPWQRAGLRPSTWPLLLSWESLLPTSAQLRWLFQAERVPGLVVLVAWEVDGFESQ